MAQPQIGVITNPNSKKNRLNPRRYDTMKRLVGDVGLVKRTHHTGEIAEVVREFLDAGVPYWLADGGDGAFHAIDAQHAQHVRQPLAPAQNDMVAAVARRFR